MKNYAYPHQPIEFDFEQTIERFFVEEIPLYDFSNSGNFLILKIKKQDMSTWKLIHVLTKATLLQEREIGYAGLKDKSATTIQYISIPKSVQNGLKNLTTDKIEILEQHTSKFPIKIGQLKGNRFSIVLYKVNPQSYDAFKRVASQISIEGIPNYFGYQRFGEDSKSYMQGEKIAQSGKKLKGTKEKLLVASYQSYLFNSWLAKRVEISTIITQETTKVAAQKLKFPLPLAEALKQQSQFFKLFLGDCMQSYPDGKLTNVRHLDKDSKIFKLAKATPTGLIAGSHSQRSISDAYHLEEPFDDKDLTTLRGDRRAAWIWPTDLTFSYDEKQERLTFGFVLPRGAYATTLLEEIGKKRLKTIPQDDL